MSQRWNQFFCHLQKDLKMWLFFMLVLTLNRLAFIAVSAMRSTVITLPPTSWRQQPMVFAST